MTAEEAMNIGLQIAERHKNNALTLARVDMESGPFKHDLIALERVLHGCEIALAAEIMRALQRTS